MTSASLAPIRQAARLRGAGGHDGIETIARQEKASDAAATTMIAAFMMAVLTASTRLI